MARLSAAVAILALLLSSPVLAKDVVTADSVAGQNITAAANFIRDNGRTDVADNIVDFLKREKFYTDNINEPGTSAKTSSLSNITIDKTQAAPLTKALDPDKQLRLLAGLAAIIFHEKVHAHQGWGKFLSESGEYDAWTQTIYEIDRWVYHARAKYDRSHDKKDLAKMGELVDVKVTELQGFIENKCFGGNCALWQDLLDTIKKLAGAVEKEKNRLAMAPAPNPPKANDGRVGMLVDDAGKKDQVALAGPKPPAPASSVKSWPGLALDPPVCFASTAEKAKNEKAIEAQIAKSETVAAAAASSLAAAKADSEVDGYGEMLAHAGAAPLCPKKAKQRSEDDPLYMQNYRAPAKPKSQRNSSGNYEGPPPEERDEREQELPRDNEPEIPMPH
ncbi:MAG: hypothetical protein HY243_01295 [Proteobacteria bacterium]|nr:hypothetical protein [Pseudomonadota bacterium]